MNSSRESGWVDDKARQQKHELEVSDGVALGLPAPPEWRFNKQNGFLEKSPPDERHVAVYPYNAKERDELSFLSGDTVVVVQKDPSGWWKGYVVGKPDSVGVFPASYLTTPDV